MHTRCPGCHTVHPVNAALLAQDRGKYRCGKCNQINNALEFLFDEWPDPGDRPPAAGELPVLGLKLDLLAAKQARPGHDSFSSAEKTPNDQRSSQNGTPLKAAWITAAVVLIFLVTIYLYEFFQPPLLNSLSSRDTTNEAGQAEASTAAPFRKLDQIQLLSRDMRSHSSRPDVLSLSLTIVNRASRSQAYPDLDVGLLDSSGQMLVSHRFEPRQYLASGAAIEAGMTPQARLHISLELADPGRQAVGFELHFR